MNRAIYNAYQLLYHAIQDNVEDVNSVRRQKNGRWVYPTLPTSLDTNYPRVTIKLNSFSLKPATAGGIFYRRGAVTSYGYEVELGFTILLFVNKEMEYPISIDGHEVRAKNELLVEYLSTQIYQTLFKLITNGYFKDKGFWVLPSSLTYTPSIWEYDTSRLVSELGITLNTYEELTEEVSDGNIIEVVKLLINPEG